MGDKEGENTTGVPEPRMRLELGMTRRHGQTRREVTTVCNVCNAPLLFGISRSYLDHVSV